MCGSIMSMNFIKQLDFVWLSATDQDELYVTVNVRPISSTTPILLSSVIAAAHFSRMAVQVPLATLCNLFNVASSNTISSLIYASHRFQNTQKCVSKDIRNATTKQLMIHQRQFHAVIFSISPVMDPPGNDITRFMNN